MAKCPRCGAENRDEARFCDACGFPFAPAGADYGPPPGTLSNRLMVWDWNARWAIVAVMGLAMGVFMIAIAIAKDIPSISGFGFLMIILGLLGTLVTYMNIQRCAGPDPDGIQEDIKR